MVWELPRRFLNTIMASLKTKYCISDKHLQVSMKSSFQATHSFHSTALLPIFIRAQLKNGKRLIKLKNWALWNKFDSTIMTKFRSLMDMQASLKNYTGCSKSNVSYFITPAHSVRGRSWWYGSRGWTFLATLLGFVTVWQMAAEGQSDKNGVCSGSAYEAKA